MVNALFVCLVNVLMNHRHLLTLITMSLISMGCVEDNDSVRKLKPGVSFDVYAVVAEPTESTKELKDRDTGKPLYLVTPPVVTADDVAAADVVTDEQGTVSFKGTLTDDGGTKMADATQTVGGRLAILVDGELVSSPKINAQIARQFTVTGDSKQFDWNTILE